MINHEYEMWLDSVATTPDVEPCATCDGTGEVPAPAPYYSDPCPECGEIEVLF